MPAQAPHFLVEAKGVQKTARNRPPVCGAVGVLVE
jgi:hypothetical protein